MERRGHADTSKQDEHIQQLNNSLAAAFTAKAAVIPHERLRELMEPARDAGGTAARRRRRCDIDESMVLDLSGHESDELEVVARRRLDADRRPCWPGRASCRWAAGTCSTTATATSRCSWPGRACASSSRCSSRPRAAACCSSSSRLAAFLQAGPAGAGAGRVAHRARHAQRAGQARRRSGATAELKAAWRRAAWGRDGASRLQAARAGAPRRAARPGVSGSAGRPPRRRARRGSARRAPRPGSRTPSAR